MGNIDFRISVGSYPCFYKPISIKDGILGNQQVMYFLTHPRHWYSNFRVNTKDGF